MLNHNKMESQKLKQYKKVYLISTVMLNCNKMESQKLMQHNIVYLISFILTFVSFKFYNKFYETYQFFPCKKAYYVKGKIFSKKCIENRAFYSMV